MKEDLVIVHTHFHKRRTGITRSIENVMPYLKEMSNTYLYGYGIEGSKLTKSQFKEILFSEKKVVVHCHRNNEIIKVLWYRLLGANFKLVTTRHAETTPSSLTKFLLKKSDEVITLTSSMHKKLGLKNTIVSHGVKTDVFQPQKDVKIKDVLQSNIILCAGRVREAKGQKVLLGALAPMLGGFSDWALVVVGKVDKPVFLQELKKIVEECGVEKQVYFINETTDIVSYYQASKILVAPSFSEGFSLVCVEAMSCGNTVVATKNVGVHSELITEGETGYLFDSGDVNGLGTVVNKILLGDFSELGENARKEVLTNWSAKKEAKELFTVYKK